MRLIYNLLRYAKVFGFPHFFSIFFKIKTNSTQSIKVPGIKTPIFLRKNTSDIPTFLQLFLEKDYELEFVENPKTIIDAGANVGLFSLIMKNKFPDSHVIALEPDDSNCQVVKRNLSSYEGFSLENKGVWNRSAFLKVTDKIKLGQWALMVEEVEEKDADVEAIGINELMQKYSLNQIDILKIDIETSEKQLFSSNYEDWLPKTRMIIIELHDWIEVGTARPFLEAINQCFTEYKFLVKGEHVILYNLGKV